MAVGLPARPPCGPPGHSHEPVSVQGFRPPTRTPSRTKSPALGAPGTPQPAGPRLCPGPPVHPPAGPFPRVPVVWRWVLWIGVDALHPIASLGDRRLELDREQNSVPISLAMSMALAIGGGGRGGVGAASAAPPAALAGRRAMGYAARSGGCGVGPGGVPGACGGAGGCPGLVLPAPTRPPQSQFRVFWVCADGFSGTALTRFVPSLRSGTMNLISLRGAGRRPRPKGAGRAPVRFRLAGTVG